MIGEIATQKTICSLHLRLVFFKESKPESNLIVYFANASHTKRSSKKGNNQRYLPLSNLNVWNAE